tara:strand:+ start:166 stop:315 length:150 start_codon:yes stop_codon:yes gene_type:complete
MSIKTKIVDWAAYDSKTCIEDEVVYREDFPEEFFISAGAVEKVIHGGKK